MATSPLGTFRTSRGPDRAFRRPTAPRFDGSSTSGRSPPAPQCYSRASGRLPARIGRDILIGMASLRNFSAHGVNAIQAVHRALAQHAPHLVGHFDRAVLEVRFAPSLCQPGSAACVRPDVHRVVLFAVAPEHMTMAELGRVLLHEARHLQQRVDGYWSILPHSCSDAFCTRPAERADDFVYRGDVAVLPEIVRALRAAGWAAKAPWIAPPSTDGPDLLLTILGVGLGLGATALVGAAAANRMTKTWDPRVQRYRGSNGEYRGSGLFE